MTILGLDLGERRIGVALSDPTGTVAVPLLTISHTAVRRDLAEVAQLAKSRRVERIVVGWPRNMDGTSGPAARKGRRHTVTRKILSISARIGMILGSTA